LVGSYEGVFRIIGKLVRVKVHHAT
jgi:hypothetical protein